MLKLIPEWKVAAYRRGVGKVAKIFSSSFAEDGVILLLPLVRMRFLVAPMDWIQWSFVVVPRATTSGERTLVFEIDPDGRPIERNDDRPR